MKKEFLGRIIYDTALLVSVLFFSWWITAIFVCVGVVLYERYIECIIVGIIMDLLYEVRIFPVIFTLSFFCIYIILGRMKKQVRIYG